MELHFDSLTQVVENPMFLDWYNDENTIDYKDVKFLKMVGQGEISFSWLASTSLQCVKFSCSFR